MELNERLVLLSLQLRSEALDRNADYSANWISSGLPTIQELSDGKSVFYEQVTGVKVWSLSFLHRPFAFVVGCVAPHVAFHRVSIRTLCELT